MGKSNDLTRSETFIETCSRSLFSTTFFRGHASEWWMKDGLYPVSNCPGRSSDLHRKGTFFSGNRGLSGGFPHISTTKTGTFNKIRRNSFTRPENEGVNIRKRDESVRTDSSLEKKHA